MVFTGLIMPNTEPSFGAHPRDSCRLERARARHVLEDDCGIAGDMAAEMAHDHAQIELEGRARPVADDRLHGAAAIERRHRILLGTRVRHASERATDDARASIKPRMTIAHSG